MTRILRLISPLAIVLSATLLAEAGGPAAPNPLQGINPQTAETIRNLWMLRGLQGRGGRGVQTGVANPFMDGMPQLEYPQFPQFQDPNDYPAASGSGSSSSKEKRAEARRLKEERKRQARAEKEALKNKPTPARTASGKVIRQPNPAIPAPAPRGKANRNQQNP